MDWFTTERATTYSIKVLKDEHNGLCLWTSSNV